MENDKEFKIMITIFIIGSAFCAFGVLSYWMPEMPFKLKLLVSGLCAITCIPGMAMYIIGLVTLPILLLGLFVKI